MLRAGQACLAYIFLFKYRLLDLVRGSFVPEVFEVVSPVLHHPGSAF